MLKFRLSENCHLPVPHSTYFCSMIKSILAYASLLIIIISCSNQDHDKPGSEGGSSAMPEREKTLLDSIASYPDSLLIKVKLIQFYRDAEDLEKAIVVANDAIIKDSLNDNLWDIKGTLFYENEDTVNAIRAFETAVQLNPQPRYIILLGSLYAQTKDKKALDMADFLLLNKIAETDKEAFFIKGLYYNYTMEFQKAIPFFDQCLEIDHAYMLAYREKGIALYEQERYNDAVSVLDKAVTLRNNFDEGYYWLGRSLEKLNKPKEAIEEYKMALLYAPDFIEAEEALNRLKAP